MSDLEFIFGGSFDPIHFGHLHVIHQLTKVCPGWPIRIIPCAVPALKSQTSASFEHRVKMIELALAPLKNITVDQREVRRQGKSYTYDTLLELSKLLPNRRFVLVLGSDNLQSIERWHCAEKLTEQCHILVVNRPNASLETLAEKMQQLGFNVANDIAGLESKANGLYYCLTIEEKNISSTAIRCQLNERDNNYTPNELREMNTKQVFPLIDIPEVVKDYIRNNLIYL